MNVITHVITAEPVPYRSGGVTRTLMNTSETPITMELQGIKLHDKINNRIIFVPFTNIPYMIMEGENESQGNASTVSAEGQKRRIKVP